MSYALKEIYYTLQGEGAQAGRAAVFARFTGCNLWSGREADRATAACWFCDTDFVGTDGPGGGRFADAEALSAALHERWPGGGRPYVVFTGGEPMLQLDEALVDACHAAGFEVAIETNGTRAVPPSVDWICVSPKPDSPVVQTHGHELKLVYPQAITPASVAHLDFEHFFLQPLDDPSGARHVAACVAYCQAHPQWRLSLQTHKLIGIP
ncbi:MAG: 7-carboxy-7-deazaguanine synthase [Bradymonadia bacterium]|jgi:7-carboxy-7-deazaguanine synthase